MTATNHRDTSPADRRYNCVAWAAEDTEHWWEPGVFWSPQDWPVDDSGIGALERAFLSLGYEDCGTNWSLEPGYLKVALYSSGGFTYTHAARQLSSDKWTSKLGKSVEIEHDTPDVVAGGLYGEVVQIMRKAIPPSE
ncbi:hypothetical protein VT84_21385 [Gemmata sp. SH-PL17]|uniref:DUF7689 domain-containing protein n=1 Tax=Gemmata sp. SH-PL17 TaxID=1630693 RepID=UPI0004B69D78|nr:hypothetical protein [Gemmata sp. SH-PL17]AMV26969.1 hypothetical protein VT84_21385 [Gemmata sp. SH-PL17]